MYCKNCGAPISDGAMVCEHCGKEVPQSASSTQKTGGNVLRSSTKGNFKSNDGKLITGVCAGLAKKYDKNVWMFRLIFIIGGFIPLLGWFLLGYYVFAAIAWKCDD